MSIIHTKEHRFEWVKGWLTGGTDPADGSVECGDGTLYPMEVTLDQLAEIFYRARDGKFDAGSYGFTYPGFADTLNFVITNVTPPTDYSTRYVAPIDGEYDYYVEAERGQTEIPVGGVTSPPSAIEPVGIDAEHKIWGINSNQEFYYGYPNALDHYIGFDYSTFDTLMNFAPSSYYTAYYEDEIEGEYYVGPAFADLYIGVNVAIVNTSGDGNYDISNPTNKFYIYSSAGFGLWGYHSVSSYKYYSGMTLAALTFEIVLSSGTISMPLYEDKELENWASGVFRYRVTEWWGYNGKFNTATGARL